MKYGHVLSATVQDAPAAVPKSFSNKSPLPNQAIYQINNIYKFNPFSSMLPSSSYTLLLEYMHYSCKSVESRKDRQLASNLDFE